MKNLGEVIIVFIIIFFTSYFSAIPILLVEIIVRNNFLSIIMLIIIHILNFILLIKKLHKKNIVIGIISFTIFNILFSLRVYIKTLHDLDIIFNFFQTLNFTTNTIFTNIWLADYKLFIIIAPISTFLIHFISYKIACYFATKK